MNELPATPSPATGPTSGTGPSSRTGRPKRLLVTATLATLACLLGTACGQDNPQKPKPAATAQTATPAPAAAPTPPEHPRAAVKRLLVVGDSLSISLGEQLEHALADAPGLDYTRDGTRSTGLTRPELLDWPARLRELTAKNPPDVVIIMIGANDEMPIAAADGSRVYFESSAWVDAYAAKARELVDICHQANPAVTIYWVGVPSMGEASLAAGVKKVNAALAAMCAAAGCRFIDTEAAFSDPDGHFTRHARDVATGDAVPIRTADGVHLTDTGSRLLAGVVLEALADREHLPPSAGATELRAQARDLRALAEEPRQQHQPVREPAAKTKVKRSNKTYAVRSGDTFLTIGKRMGLDPDDIAAVNPGVDSRRLSIGQTLRLPAKR